MKQYEEDMHAKWVARTEETLPNLLKRSILSKPPPTPIPASLAQTPLPGDSRSASRAADYSHILPPGEAMCILPVVLYMYYVFVCVCMCVCACAWVS